MGHDSFLNIKEKVSGIITITITTPFHFFFLRQGTQLAVSERVNFHLMAEHKKSAITMTRKDIGK